MALLKKCLLSVSLLALFVGFTAQGASANTIYILDQPNDGISSYTGPYGQVEVELLDANTAQITFTSYSGYLFVDGSAVDLSTDGTYNGDAVTDPLHVISDSGSGTADGFGTYDIRLTTGNAAIGVESVTFTIDLASGTWASSDDVLILNDKDYYAAAHIGVVGSSCGGSPCTGFASTNGSSVPDGGSTMTLLGSALVAFGLLRRRFSKN